MPAKTEESKFLVVKSLTAASEGVENVRRAGRTSLVENIMLEM